jgi:hypothetical protein
MRMESRRDKIGQPTPAKDELRDDQLNAVTGGLVVPAIIAVLIGDISITQPSSPQPTTNGQRGKGGQIGP